MEVGGRGHSTMEVGGRGTVLWRLGGRGHSTMEAESHLTYPSSARY